MIVGLVGFIGSGKGTVASQLVEEYNFRQDSFASSLKDACSSIFGWPRNMLEGDTAESRRWREEPDPWWAHSLSYPGFSPRIALQQMGTNVIRDNFNDNIWLLSVLNRYERNKTQNVVISDVRFPNEIKFIQENGGKLIQISRGEQPVWYETAVLANRGNSVALEAMKKTYPSVHFSEWAWAGVNPDYHITNNGTLEELKSQVKDMVSGIA